MPTNQDSPEIEEIWQLFGQENKECLDLVEDSLLELEKNPTNDGLIAAIFRAIHTYKGGSRMMGLNVLESLAHRTEDLASLLREHKMTPDPAVTEVLLKVNDKLRQLLDFVITERHDVEKNQIEDVMLQLDALIATQNETSASEEPTPQTTEEEMIPPSAAENISLPNLETEPKDIQAPSTLEPEDLSKEVSSAETTSSAEPVFISTHVLTHDVDQINPATDAKYLDIFLEMAQDELNQIHHNIEALANGDQEAAQKLISGADSFKYAAERMGYINLVSSLDEMIQTTGQFNRDSGGSPEAWFAQIKEQETHIKDLIRALEIPASPSAYIQQPETGAAPDTSEIIRQWRAEKSLTHLSREAMDNLKRSIGEILSDYSLLHQSVEHLYDSDMGGFLERILNGQEEQTIADVEASLQIWSDDLHTLRQVERKMGAALDQIQEQVRSLGLKSVAEVLQPLEHMIRDMEERGGKQVVLETTGSDLELDGSLLQTLSTPLNNLVWFSITQGIELPEERRTAGKDLIGKIKVSIKQREDHVVIMIEDDGRGLEREVIEERACQLGWIEKPGSASDDWIQYLLRPGFGSLGSQDGGLNFCDLAERLKAQRGNLTIFSNPGEGARFTIRLPIDMAVVDSLVIRIAQIYYVLPISAVRRIVWLEKEKLVHSSAEGQELFIHHEGNLVPVCYLNANTREKDLLSFLVIVLVNGEGELRALFVDELVGQQQAIVYPLQGILADVKNYSGCALLGNGEIGMILNLDSALFA